MQFPSPFLILGDFNAHSPLWGSPNINPREQTIQSQTTIYAFSITEKTHIFMNHPDLFMQ